MPGLEVRSEIARKRFPRLFLAAHGERNAPLTDVFVMFTDRVMSPVWDLSEAGLVVSSVGMLGQMRLGRHFDVKLRIQGQDPQTLSVKVSQLSAGFIFLALDSLTVTGRLKLDQDERELLIRNSWRQLSSRDLHPAFQNAEWWHSTFDSNLWVWRDSAGVPEKVILEFESVALIYDNQGTRFLKAPAAFEESKGYAGPFTDPLSHKVEPGHNWGERFRKVIGGALAPSMVGDLWVLLPRTPAKALHV